MNLQLSGQITIHNTAERYFRPKDAFEVSELCRFERLCTDIYEDHHAAAHTTALQVAAIICDALAQGNAFHLGVSVGRSLQPLWSALVSELSSKSLDLSLLHVYLTYEFYGVEGEGVVYSQLREQLFAPLSLPVENIHAPNGAMPKEEIAAYCAGLEEQLQAVGGLDLVLLGVGSDGVVALNQPGSSRACITRLAILNSKAYKESLKSLTANSVVPKRVITMGMSTLLAAKEVVLITFGEEKAHFMKQIVEGGHNEWFPASLFQLHKRARMVCDISAAHLLTRIHTPWLVTSCLWDDALIRKAVVQLSLDKQTPILKLTDKEYQEGGLSELLTLYHSAYDVNIKVFNELQHTITGWPGGKPDADDTYRPERAKPFPKCALIFSPHPDDDVISMGGCFHRLVVQGHEVHVAYQTSGNIAVGDEELVKMINTFRQVSDLCGVALPEALTQRQDAMMQRLTSDQPTHETAETLCLKGLIRRIEAKAACSYVGVPSERAHFLNLPFYETGEIKKKPISEADVEIIIALLRDLQPHQIYFAGDLLDPHGTHRVCADALLAALDCVKAEAWMADCRVWMYRGAWDEWGIDQIEMAVPLSPEELRFKRNAILRHSSQMESAPFLGDDERLFWQRSEDRNRATAELYRQLGLASYEAMEAFVQYHP